MDGTSWTYGTSGVTETESVVYSASEASWYLIRAPNSQMVHLTINLFVLHSITQSISLSVRLLQHNVFVYSFFVCLPFIIQNKVNITFFVN